MGLCKVWDVIIYKVQMKLTQQQLCKARFAWFHVLIRELKLSEKRQGISGLSVSLLKTEAEEQPTE